MQSEPHEDLRCRFSFLKKSRLLLCKTGWPSTPLQWHYSILQAQAIATWNIHIQSLCKLPTIVTRAARTEHFSRRCMWALTRRLRLWEVLCSVVCHTLQMTTINEVNARRQFTTSRHVNNRTTVLVRTCIHTCTTTVTTAVMLVMLWGWLFCCDVVVSN